MPRGPQAYDNYGSAVQDIILAASDADFIDQLVPVLRDATVHSRAAALNQSLAQYVDDRDAEIERIGLTQHEEFLGSVSQLQKVREGTVALTAEILELNQSIQASTETLAAQKRALVDTRAVRQNLADAAEALQASLRILHAVNAAHELVRKKSYYGALKALEDLQNEHLVPLIQNRYATQHALAALIQRSIPASQRAIAEAVMTDLNTWLYRVRETSQFLGEVAFYHTDLRRTRMKDRVEQNAFLRHFRLNSAIERVFDESEAFDVLDNDEVQVDFTPLFEALHIHAALGQSERFRADYAATRRQQKDLLLPAAVNLEEPDGDGSGTAADGANGGLPSAPGTTASASAATSSNNNNNANANAVPLSSLLEGVAGFAIIEKATLRRAPQLRSPADVDALWDAMCQTVINLITKALRDVSNAEVLLKLKGMIALFVQTMDGWGYSVTLLDNFLLRLFDKYAELLQRRFSEDFQEIVSTDDYMPMTINTLEEYEKVVNVSWFAQDKPPSELTFPCVLPFSQMYPLCCIDIRNFLNQFYFFSDDHFQHANVIDETLRKSLDELLTNRICGSLVERLSSQYLGQIVQILINLEHFETACQELEQLLIRARSSTSAGGPVTLTATEQFRSHKKTAEKRIFELVNSKIDDLVDTAEYDWTAAAPQREPSNYIQTLTRYLANIMSSTLLSLPREIKELIYYDALSHAADKILNLPLASEVRHINPHGVADLARDVRYLTEFVGSLDNAFMLQQNLDELQQSVALMQTDNADEFYDITTRNKKYGRVNAQNGAILLEKITHTVEGPNRAAQGLANFSSRFGLR
ncbi:exocyst complex component [Niveomyces insectorum RCEF 264]|uniref:Exocyst complex component SEC15 n=1 Tax=Niveomyces insectorum RCEF 264 TaxID=1081102 RepID=A0A167NIZ7_9HYPO|nr:exocyst complex component [Niveomyces insectorum RCEF 264]